MKAMMGKTSPDPMGELLGTGYQRFQAHCGINGLAKDDAEHLEVLAVDANKPGTGQFRKFIELAKKNYRCVTIWEVWNDDLRNALSRYGFEPCQKTMPWGEQVTGMIWRATPGCPLDAQKAT